MKEKQQNIIQATMLLGIFLGVYQTVTLISMILTVNFKIGSFIFMLLTLGLPFVAGFLIKKFRDKNNIVFFPFSMAWLFSLLTFMFASLLSVMLFYLFLRFIDNGQFLANMSSMFEEFKQMLEQLNKLNDNTIPFSFFDQIDSYIEYYKSLSITGLIKDLFSTNLLWGNIFSLIIAIFVKRKKIA
ncbi:MAG TPA: DUF4199 domain-containing protein [Bacteroidaceae bacterium]|nr:DUF4199 domain-containing protein [Bacteroidaceae bacterium]